MSHAEPPRSSWESQGDTPTVVRGSCFDFFHLPWHFCWLNVSKRELETLTNASPEYSWKWTRETHSLTSWKVNNCVCLCTCLMVPGKYNTPRSSAQGLSPAACSFFKTQGCLSPLPGVHRASRPPETSPLEVLFTGLCNHQIVWHRALGIFPWLSPLLSPHFASARGPAGAQHSCGRTESFPHSRVCQTVGGW